MKLTVPTTYAQLRAQVKETLLLGQRKIEEARTQTYWQTGWLISEHVFMHRSRSEHYGDEVIRRLAEDLDVGPHLLYRCVRFARAFRDISFLTGAEPPKKIVAGRLQSFGRQLKWSHFRELSKIPDEETRMSFMRRAIEKGWTAEELAEKIRIETAGELKGSATTSKDARTRSGTLRGAKLIPKKGLLYTYRLIGPDSVHIEEDSRPLKHKVDAKGILWIDLGFQIHRKLAKNSPKFKPGAIIESRYEKDKYSARLSTRGEKDLYTYKAYVERVVDGDTLLVRVDLGFETRIRQYLRLRGIDAFELSESKGKEAAAFVVRELSKVDHIIMTSSRPDKYGRYLADVYYGAWGQVDPKGEADNLIYLNQRLLDEGLAGKM